MWLDVASDDVVGDDLADSWRTSLCDDVGSVTRHEIALSSSWACLRIAWKRVSVPSG